MQSMMLRKAYGIPQYIEIILSVVDSIAAGIAGNYIYIKLIEHNGGNLSIRYQPARGSPRQRKITKMIEEEIATQRK